MKVVLFCGGQGMRLREYSHQVPKPMVPLGDRPILWHLMKYYAHHGHKEFVLCLGYRGTAIKDYFLTYQEEISNDFRLRNGDRELFSSDIHDWDITFADTGLHSLHGERLRRVRKYLGDDDIFLANYADGLADLDLPRYLENFERSGALASIMAVRAWHSYHRLQFDDRMYLTALEPVSSADIWFNAGFFAFRKEFIDLVEPGEDLINGLLRAAKQDGVLIQPHEGFFASMDTFKDKVELDGRYERGDSPWVVWKNGE
ncbi:MAG TPA: sugar phosphate nucleotidyltransferase [Acidimicrobiia bacterium]|jgi:glucose-1-phosphate cytidylyltransferase|nr:sugar phosphate nucleotidyltransferase [Acidimicrobiia bacterium]